MAGLRRRQILAGSSAASSYCVVTASQLYLSRGALRCFRAEIRAFLLAHLEGFPDARDEPGFIPIRQTRVAAHLVVFRLLEIEHETAPPIASISAGCVPPTSVACT